MAEHLYSKGNAFRHNDAVSTYLFFLGDEVLLKHAESINGITLKVQHHFALQHDSDLNFSLFFF